MDRNRRFRSLKIHALQSVRSTSQCMHWILNWARSHAWTYYAQLFDSYWPCKMACMAKIKCKFGRASNKKKYYVMRVAVVSMNNKRQETSSHTIGSVECHRRHANVREWTAYSLFCCRCVCELRVLLRFCRFRYSNGFISGLFEAKQEQWIKKTATWHNPFGMCEYYNRMICYAICCQWACAYLFEVISFRPVVSSRLRTSATKYPHTRLLTCSFQSRSIDRLISPCHNLFQ